MAPKIAALPAAAAASSSSDSDDAEPAPSRPPTKPLVTSSAVATSTPNKKNKGKGQKRPRFQRIWSDEDEIALLNGLLNYKVENGNFPNMRIFSDIINKDLTLDVDELRVYEKLRRIKNKYMAADCKAPATSSTHDTEIFKLAHKLWAKEDGNGGAVGSKAGGERENVKPRYTFLKHAVTQMSNCLPNHVDLEEVLDFVHASKATAIEEKLKMLWYKKQKQQIWEMDLKKEAMKMISEALDKMV